MTAPIMEAGAARIEIFERHKGERYPNAGAGSILVPNEIRINGVKMWCPESNPVEVGPIRLGDRDPLIVPLRLFVRRLRFGVDGRAESLGLALDDDTASAILDVPAESSFAEGQQLTPPYVLLNGTALLRTGAIAVHLMKMRGDAAVVSLSLLARSVVIDDALDD